MAQADALERHSESLLSDEAERMLILNRERWRAAGDDEAVNSAEAVLALRRQVLDDGLAAVVANLRSEQQVMAVREFVEAQLLLEDPSPDSVDRAIALLERSVTHFTGAGLGFSHVYEALGRAHILRQSGDRSEDLRVAREYLERELTDAQDRGSADDLAVTHRLLTNVFRELGDRAEAVRHLEAALAVQPARPGEAGAWAWLELATLDSQIQGQDRSEGIDRAIAAVETAISLAPADSAIAATAHMRQEDLVRNRVRGDRGDNLARAFEELAAAQSFFLRERYPDEWAQLQHNEGTLHYQDPRGDRAAALERALACYKRALEVHTSDAFPDYFGLTNTSIASALIERISGSRQRNFEEALERLLAAQRVLDRERSKVWWAECQTGLGIVYQGMVGPAREENLRRAIGHLEAARRAYHELGNVERESVTESNMAAVLVSLGAYDPTAFDEATTAMERALAHLARDQDPYRWGIYKRNLAAARVRRTDATAEDRALAKADLEAALEVQAPSSYPAEAGKTLEYLGHLAFDARDWPAAVAAYIESIRIGQGLFVSAYTEAGRRSAIHDTGLQHVRAAYALAKVGDIGDALLILEQGKSRLMADTITLSGVDLAGMPPELETRLRTDRDAVRALEGQLRAIIQSGDGRAAEVGERLGAERARLGRTLQEASAHAPYLTKRLERWEDIVATIPPGGALIAFATTSAGSMAIVTPAATQLLTREHVVDLDDVTTDDVERLLGAWTALLDPAADVWSGEMTRIAGDLWPSIVGPVHERLRRLGVAPGAPVVIVPQGGLWLLPLHAAWRAVDAGPRALADDYVVSYAPSMYVRSVCLERLRGRDVAEPSVLAIANPAGDLPYADHEATTIARLFVAPSILKGPEATNRAVENRAATMSHLHFACHASHDWVDVMQSGLDLAPPDRLTLDRILASMSLDACRLVAVSACETGLTDVRSSPDEYLGLPAGFLLAGACGVLSSLWKVDDAATFLLITKFYERLLDEARPAMPADALRDAQTWLRNLTVADLRNLPFELDLEANYRDLLGDLDRSTRLFDQTFFWAAFTFTGA